LLVWSEAQWPTLSAAKLGPTAAGWAPQHGAAVEAGIQIASGIAGNVLGSRSYALG
jgi:hypothetical protein